MADVELLQQIQRSFRQHMSAAMGAFKLLAETIDPDQLNKVIVVLGQTLHFMHTDHENSSVSTCMQSFDLTCTAGASEVNSVLGKC